MGPQHSSLVCTSVAVLPVVISGSPVPPGHQDATVPVTFPVLVQSVLTP